MVIHYTNATASHKHMVNVTLTPDQAPLSPAAEEAPAEDGQTNEAAQAAVPRDDIL
jgi:hypothetical protein